MIIKIIIEMKFQLIIIVFISLISPLSKNTHTTRFVKVTSTFKTILAKDKYNKTKAI
jgi:hypothetical protein